MMAALPSYQEATARLDGLAIVVPYVAFADYRALCLVDHRFWSVFAPKLWGNLLSSVRQSGLDPGDGTLTPYATPSGLKLRTDS